MVQIHGRQTHSPPLHSCNMRISKRYLTPNYEAAAIVRWFATAGKRKACNRSAGEIIGHASVLSGSERNAVGKLLVATVSHIH